MQYVFDRDRGIIFGMVVMFESGMVIVCAGVAEQELLVDE
jgi:hypothetical protein